MWDTFYGNREQTSSSGDLLHEKTEMCFFKTFVNFGCCYGNQGLANVVENNFFFLQNSSCKLSENFESVAQGVLEIFEEVYREGGGTMPPPPCLG